MLWVWVLVALLLVTAVSLLGAGYLLRARSGLPGGSLIYNDTGMREEIEKPLISQRLGLIGRPDYLLHRTEQGRKTIIPVEVKSGRRPRLEHPGHTLQVGAYCLLVEEHYGVTSAYGLLRYADATLPVPLTPELRAAVAQAAAEIRAARSAADVPRHHDIPARCTRCGYRSACGQALS